jgi:tight adherence protein C
MAIPIAVFLFLFLFASIAAFGYKHYLKPTRIVQQLGGRAELPGFEFQIPGAPEQPKRLAQILGNIGGIFPVSPQEIEFTRKMLQSAGFRKDFAVKAFYGVRLLAIAGCVVLAILLRDQITDNPVLRVVIVAAGGALGFYGPGYGLEHLIKRRRRRIRIALPDVLDLLVVCTEAGCALDLAILKVSDELGPVHPDICEELSLISLEMLAGKARMEAMRNFAARTGDAEVKKLVAVLVQTDKFGTSVSDALRTQSDFLRTRRRQESEEKAGKVGVKLVFPIFFFCLPSLFIVTAGPGILQLVKNLFPMMKQFHS